LASAVTHEAAGTPFAPHSGAISDALRNGGARQLFGTVPVQQRGALAEVVRGSFTTALNEILLVAAIISFVAGVLAFALIRAKDFAGHGPQQAPSA